MGAIRFLLAVSVAIYHGAPLFGYPMVWGPNAVTLFFVISGFYMTLVLNGKYEAGGRAFLINRALKIFPAYWVVILICHLVNPIPFGTMPLKTVGYFVWSNIAIIGSHMTAILQLNPSGALVPLPLNGQFTDGVAAWGGLYFGPVWSLSVELLFYMAAPLIVRMDGRYLWRMGMATLLSFSALLFYRTQHAPAVPWEYNLFLPNLMFFLFGSLSYAGFSSGLFTKVVSFNRFSGWGMFAVLLGAIALYPMVPKINVGPLHLSTLQVACIILLVAMPYVFQLFRNSRIDRYIGNLSYPIYVVHFMVINHFRGAVSDEWKLAVTVVLSVVIYHVVMVPVETFLARKPEKAVGKRALSDLG